MRCTTALSGDLSKLGVNDTQLRHRGSSTESTQNLLLTVCTESLEHNTPSISGCTEPSPPARIYTAASGREKRAQVVTTTNLMQAEAQTAMLKPVLEGLTVAYFKHELQTKQTVWV